RIGTIVHLEACLISEQDIESKMAICKGIGPTADEFRDRVGIHYAVCGLGDRAATRRTDVLGLAVGRGRPGGLAGSRAKRVVNLLTLRVQEDASSATWIYTSCTGDPEITKSIAGFGLIDRF